MSLDLLSKSTGSGAASDAFGRLRVSDPQTIFDSKQIFDNGPLFWDDIEASGSGTSSVHSANAARTRIGVSLNTAGKRVRQTFQRFNYQPGKSTLVLLTARMGTPVSGINACLGLFDDNNGIFFQADGTNIQVVCRSNVTGTPVDTAVTSANVNGDPMDGTGPSGITLDPTKTQIMWFDMERLGVGRVRSGFVIDGSYIVFHEFFNTNVIDVVYMSTPNLPLRYEIENDGTGAATTMDHICSTVITEGGAEDTGILRYDSTGTTAINANSAGVTYVICAIRLKTAYIGATVKLIAQSMIATTSDDYEWTIVLNPTIATAVTFADQTNSAIQFAPGNAGNPSTSTVTGGTKLMGGFVTAGSTSGAVTIGLENALHLGSQIGGTRDEIYLCVTPFSANADINGGLTWRELL